MLCLFAKYHNPSSYLPVAIRVSLKASVRQPLCLIYRWSDNDRRAEGRRTPRIETRAIQSPTVAFICFIQYSSHFNVYLFPISFAYSVSFEFIPSSKGIQNSSFIACSLYYSLLKLRERSSMCDAFLCY